MTNNADAVRATDDARREFIDNLTAMATGSYLREEDREFWEAPFPESAVAEASEILHRLVSGVRSEPDGEIVLQVMSAHNALKALSDRHGGAVYEDEEYEDFRDFVTVLCKEAGADGSQVLADLERVTEEDDLD